MTTPTLREILAQGKVLSQSEIFRSHLRALASRPRRTDRHCWECGQYGGHHNQCPHAEPIPDELEPHDEPEDES